jgi:hypothetical protein
MEDKRFLSRFVRRFFDTDGSVYRKYNHYAQIQIKLGCEETLTSIRQALVKIGFNPTKVQKGKNTYYDTFYWKIDLCRQKEIIRFFNEIRPSNLKHQLRYKKIKSGDTEIRTQIRRCLQ